MANNDMDRVVPLGQLDDYRVADGEPDVRGWEVLASDGRKIGEVDELLVDTAAMKVRYLDVDVDEGMVAGGPDRHVLIPIGYARLDQERDCVRLDALASSELGGVPAYDQGPLTRDFESSLRDSFPTRRPTPSQGIMDGAGMMDTAGLDNTPGLGTALGITGTLPGAGELSGTGMRAAEADPPHSTGAIRDVTSPTADGLRGGGAGSDFAYVSDEDFYASDAFDDARFYGARRGGSTTGHAPGASHDGARRGMMGEGGGPRGVGEADPPRESGLAHGQPTPHGAGQEGVGAGPQETPRLARDAGELPRGEPRNRDAGGAGSL